MKTVLALSAILIIWILAFGSPMATEKPVRSHYYGSPAPILPMTFAHLDHVTVNCIDCHHNYVDDTGNGNCMACHVSNADVWPLLEEQFHTLCRDCHANLAARGEKGGPPRQCIACHVVDTAP